MARAGGQGITTALFLLRSRMCWFLLSPCFLSAVSDVLALHSGHGRGWWSWLYTRGSSAFDVSLAWSCADQALVKCEEVWISLCLSFLWKEPSFCGGRCDMSSKRSNLKWTSIGQWVYAWDWMVPVARFEGLYYLNIYSHRRTDQCVCFLACCYMKLCCANASLSGTDSQCDCSVWWRGMKTSSWYECFGPWLIDQKRHQICCEEMQTRCPIFCWGLPTRPRCQWGLLTHLLMFVEATDSLLELSLRLLTRCSSFRSGKWHDVEVVVEATDTLIDMSFGLLSICLILCWAFMTSSYAGLSSCGWYSDQSS